jgi:hypothetical protein
VGHDLAGGEAALDLVIKGDTVILHCHWP